MEKSIGRLVQKVSEDFKWGILICLNCGCSVPEVAHSEMCYMVLIVSLNKFQCVRLSL